MTRSIHSAGLCAFAFGLTVGVASAAWSQTVDFSPIDLDVADGGDLVVASFQPSADAPIFGQTAQTGGVQVAALVAPGLPQPSIILGRIAPGEEATFGIETLLPDTVQQISFSLDDLDARNALRTENAELFAQLVNEGHLDPPDGELNRTLQIEFQRMNCYRSSIDNQWGRGSRGAVGEYFGKLDGKDWPDDQPSVELFRAVLVNGDVRCETPVAAVRTPRQSTSTTTTRQPTRTTRQPAAAPAKPAQPAAKPKLKIDTRALR